MNPSIPASQLVSVLPGVLGAGGNPLSLNSVFLTEDPSIPTGTVQGFSTLTDVQNWFGATSPEAVLAGIYFGGFINASTLPGQLFFTQFNAVDVAAYLRSGSFSGVALSVIQALSGVIDVTINGEAVTSANINLASATSFSNAAALITTGLQAAGGVFSGTGSITANLLTITAVASGVLHVGDVIAGAGVTPGTTITSLGTGTGGTGTYHTSTTPDVTSEAITVASAAVCTYDAQRAAFVITSPTTGVLSTISFATGSLSAGLKLTQVLGAVLSQGAAAATPAGTMNRVTTQTQNWATFMTVFEPLLSVKLAFAAWVNTTSPPERYAYVAWDSDLSPTTGPAPGSFGALTATYNGVIPVFDSLGVIAAFICGTAASIDFTETNGRISFAYKGQAGLVPNVTDATIANNLIGNGYNFYGAYATANQQFQFLQPGQISGGWKWIDPYINQIYLNSQFQLAFMEYLAAAKSVPYNQIGENELRQVALDPINEGLNNGSIQPGVQLSSQQAVEVNTAAGVKISDTLSNIGWYLQILPAAPLTRAARGSPPMTFWYTDGGSIQKISLNSIDIE